MFLIQRLPVATAPQRDHLTDNRQRDLLRGIGAEIETGGRPNARQSFAWNAVGLKVVENKGGPMMAGNERDVSGTGFQGPLQPQMIAFMLRRDDDEGFRVDLSLAKVEIVREKPLCVGKGLTCG